MATELVRSCVSWPDFQDWEEERNVGIKINKKMKKWKKKNPLEYIGISTKVTVVNRISYHIIDQVIDEKPDSNKVEVGHWIVCVNGHSTTGIDSSGLTKLFKDAGEQITLSIRTPKFGLRKDTLHWWKNIVELTIYQRYSNGISFRHFYTKVLNGGDIQGKILFNEKATIQRERSDKPFCFQRGDELVSVNGKPVEGKKLNEIREDITSSPTVKLSIRKIVLEDEREEFLAHEKRRENVKINLTDGWSISLLTQRFANTYFHMTEVHRGIASSQAGLCTGDQLVSVNGKNVTDLKNSEVIELIKNQNGELELELIAPERSEKIPYSEDEASNSGSGTTSQNPLFAGVSCIGTTPQESPAAGVSGSGTTPQKPPAAGVSGSGTTSQKPPVAGVSGSGDTSQNPPVADVSGSGTTPQKPPIAGVSGIGTTPQKPPVAGVDGSEEKAANNKSSSVTQQNNPGVNSNLSRNDDSDGRVFDKPSTSASLPNCSGTFTPRECLRIAQEINAKWKDVATMTNEFRHSELVCIEMDLSNRDVVSKANEMLARYVQRSGDRKALAETLKDCQLAQLAQHVLDGSFQ